MRQEIYEHVSGKKDLILFLRENKNWYTILNRDPGKLDDFQRAAAIYFGKSVPDRVYKFSNDLRTVSTLISMFQNS